jgi:hypothetical protein
MIKVAAINARGQLVMTDVATKVAYFSLTAAAVIFVSLLLTGVHP